jgi:hypothetical protein
MKNQILRNIKQFFFLLTLCMALLSGPTAGHEINKVFKNMEKRYRQVREIDDSNDDTPVP